MPNVLLRTSRRSLLALSLTAGCGLFLSLPQGAAAQTYSITNLGSLGGITQAYGLSASGATTGASNIASDVSHAFLTPSGGTIQDLGTLGGTNSYGQAVASTGPVTQVAGYSDLAGNNTQHAFLSTSTGVGSPVLRDLGTLSSTPTDNSQASGINTLGQVVGNSIINASRDDHAFRTSPDANINGATDDLGTLGGTFSNANASTPLGRWLETPSTATETTMRSAARRPGRQLC